MKATAAARAASIPVLLDGFICTAAAAPLYALSPELLDHCLVGHKSAEPGHQKLLNAMNKTPILDLDMRLGEGTGAALALCILRVQWPVITRWQLFRLQGLVIHELDWHTPSRLSLIHI